jgi:hypothetical protein
VVNPPRELWGTSRYSIPFYASGEWYEIGLFGKCIDEHPNQLKILLQWAYLYERLVDLGLDQKYSKL